jgi:predicted GNAT family acetyltransferase
LTTEGISAPLKTSRSVPICFLRSNIEDYVVSQIDTSRVRDNKDRGRFELDVNDALAFASYRRAPGKVIITHTETPAELRGRGIATRLVKGALELIRAEGLKVVAGCGFVADYLDAHPEFADLAA